MRALVKAVFCHAPGETKWVQAKSNLKVGDVDLFVDSTTPPVDRCSYALVVDTKLR